MSLWKWIAATHLYAVLAFTGCATIVSNSVYDYTLQSSLSGAAVTVWSKGEQIATVTTPGS